MRKRGFKFDTDKLKWALLPLEVMRDVVRVLMFGAEKYAPDNWKYVKDAKRRYYEACIRHLDAWQSGQRKDPETDINHIAHAICNLIFLLWHDKGGEKQKRNEVG